MNRHVDHGNALASSDSSRHLARRVAILGGLWGLAVTLALLSLPTVPFCGSVLSTNGDESVGCGAMTLIQTQGGQLEPVTWLFLIVMAASSFGGLIAAWRHQSQSSLNGMIVVILGSVLGLGMVLASLSIGLYYLPTVLLFLVGGTGLLIR